MASGNLAPLSSQSGIVGHLVPGRGLGLQGGEDSACAPGNGGRCLSRTVWPEEGVWPWFLTQRAASAPQSGAISGGWGGHRAELQCSHLRNGVASPLGSELGWAGLLREGASW